MTKTIRELFEAELKDLYDAEHRLVDALKEMTDKATDAKLAAGLKNHREQTQRQIERLERVFSDTGLRPEREECEGIEGLIQEFKSFVHNEEPSPQVLDAFAAGAARKAEHYEIVSYETLITLANQAGVGGVAGSLKENLAEEQATAKELDEMSKKLVDALA